MGRFTSVDALADHPNQVDKSPYAYAWNNPITLNDPDGNCPTCDTPKDYFVHGFSAGFSYLKGLAEAGQAIINPIETGKTIINTALAVLNSKQTAYALADGVSDAVDTYFNGTQAESGQVVGSAAAIFADVAVGSKSGSILKQQLKSLMKLPLLVEG